MMSPRIPGQELRILAAVARSWPLLVLREIWSEVGKRLRSCLGCITQDDQNIHKCPCHLGIQIYLIMVGGSFSLDLGEFWVWECYGKIV